MMSWSGNKCWCWDMSAETCPMRSELWAKAATFQPIHNCDRETLQERIKVFTEIEQKYEGRYHCSQQCYGMMRELEFQRRLLNPPEDAEDDDEEEEGGEA